LSQKHFYEFGPFRIDLGLSRLERGGDAIPLPPKAFDLLVLLARNTERVMSKTELIETLWPNTFVDEANLTQNVYMVRKALGDQPSGRPYIDTVPRRGYRLAAGVRTVTVDTHAPPGPAPPDAAGAVGAVVLEGERKRVTAVHCGLAHPADVAERLGAVEMHRLSEQLVAIAQEEVARYDGLVTQKRLDGFVALFGAREVHEDDARRAILAALAIERRVRALVLPPPALDAHIAVKIGAATGPLVISRVTERQRVDYVAVGDALRSADLLQQFAEPGTILIAEATERAVEKHFRAEPVGAVAGTHAFRVMGVQPPSHLFSQTRRPLAAYVGREREAALLDGLLAQALAGNGQVVSVVGEPGMGKSRLVYEATRAMTERPDPPAILEGRCVSYGSLIPYLPLVDLLRAECGIEDTDPPDVIQAAITRTVFENGLSGDAGAWLLRLIGIVDDATAREALSPEAVKARTFDALRLLFLRAASRHPLVVVVEDIHWIDRTSEEFLTTLAGQLMATRILLLATHRPGYRSPWMDRSYTTQITIAPLTAGDSARLLASVAGNAPIAAEISTAILRRGEGNPFFLEELARTVIEQGAGTSSIPDTVQGVILARLDRLSDVPKQLLQTASVLGREVPLRLLARVWEGPADFDAGLAEVCRQEFLYERGSAEDSFYVFKHALTQDVAYDSLLARRRRDLHLRAARALEELHEGRFDDIAATLAYHYARTDLVDDAVTWLMRAADQAARVYANAEAILHLDLAGRRLQRVPEGRDRDRRMLEVALRHAHSLYFLGRFRESVDVLLPHEARLARLDDPALTARFSFWLAHMYSRLGDQGRAAAKAFRAIDTGTRAGDIATVGKAHGLLALEGHWSGNPADGITHGEEAVRILRTHRDQRWWLGMAHFYLAVNHLLTGDFEAALAEAGRADAVGKDIGDPRLETYAGYTTGWIEASRGNADIAIAACRTSLDKAPDRVSRAYAALFLAFALLEHGDHEQALQRLEPTITELEGFAFPQWHGLAAVLTGEAHRRARRLEEAATMTRAGIEIATGAQYWYAVGTGERVGARLARDAGDLQEAAAAFDRALCTFTRIGARFEAARTRVEAGYEKSPL
jgi:DNA-binding winged helix-turn-helix (wHTH) protein/tetratricopeptide (TPR) repeat protein